MGAKFYGKKTDLGFIGNIAKTISVCFYTKHKIYRLARKTTFV